MKILFTANRFPYPPYRGDKLKIYHLARFLSLKHELHLITFLEDEKDQLYLPELEKYFQKIHLVPLTKSKSIFTALTGIGGKIPFQIRYFQSSEMKRQIRELHQKENFDVVHVQHLRMAQYWADFTDIPRILDLPDAFSLYWKRRIDTYSGIKKALARMEQKRMHQYEKICSRYDLTLVCSKEDAHYLRQEHNLKNVAILPNGVDTETFSQDRPTNYQSGNTILFTGNMDYAPNIDAVIYFTQEIFPALKKEMPQLKFIIAGQRPVAKVTALASYDIEVTGFVKDLSEYYSKATIVVSPLRFGAGTQNKVLEAMSMGIPVVCGNVGFHGLNIQSGEGVLLAKDTHTFITQCLQLLRQPELREKTGTLGKAVIRKNFSWESIARKLENYFSDIILNTAKNNTKP